MAICRRYAISRKRWYQVMLLMPVALPAVLEGINYKFPLGGFLQFLWAFSLAAAAFGGIQYLFFVAGIIWWGRNKTADQFWRFVWLWPILFLSICCLGFVATAAFTTHDMVHPAFTTHGAVNSADLRVAVWLSLCAIPIGCLNILVAVCLTYLVQKAGCIKD